MTTFERELETLIQYWISQGDHIPSMRDLLKEAEQRLEDKDNDAQ